MKIFHSDAERFPSFRHCMILEQTIDKQNFSKIQCGHSSRPERNIHKATSFVLKIFFWPMPVAISNYPKNVEKTWKIVRFPGTGPSWILYIAKLGLGSAKFFSCNYGLSPLKIHMNYMDIFSSLWGHLTGPSHDTVTYFVRPPGSVPCQFKDLG